MVHTIEDEEAKNVIGFFLSERKLKMFSRLVKVFSFGDMRAIKSESARNARFFLNENLFSSFFLLFFLMMLIAASCGEG